MLNTKQIVVLVASIILFGLLIMQPIKGLVKEDVGEAVMAEEDAEAYTLSSISEISKQGLNPSLKKDIEDLEAKLNAVSAEEATEVHETLAMKWMDVNKPAPAAFHLEEVANAHSNLENWLKAGNAYTEALEITQDTVLGKVLNQHAIGAYSKAIELDPNDLDAKTGLGSAYVQGTNPMQGISMLLEVVGEDPDNIKANYNLGIFSMQSRQFDKAVERFKTVVKQQDDPESWFYLATSYENIGLNQEAIAAFQKSEQLASDPSLTQFINRKIEELSGK